jgi:hypothetical protein
VADVAGGYCNWGWGWSERRRHLSARENQPDLFVPFFIGLSAICLATVSMQMAARGFQRDVIGASPRWLDYLIWLDLIGQMLGIAWAMAVVLGAAPVLRISDGMALQSVAWALGTCSRRWPLPLAGIRFRADSAALCLHGAGGRRLCDQPHHRSCHHADRQ